MKRLRILITTSYYWPELAGSAPYLTGVAEYLRHRGHEVVVGTTFAHYPAWRSGANGRMIASEQHEGVEIRRRWSFVPSSQSAGRRALYEATLYLPGLTALPMRRGPDVVLGTCPSLAGAALAATAAAAYRVPFGILFQDLMGLAAEQSGVAGGGVVGSIVSRAELAVARRATGVAVVAEGFRHYLERGGVAPDRITRVRNWTRTTEPTEPIEEARARLGWPADVFVCLHAGNMGHKQGLTNILGAARLLAGDGLRIALAGDGNERAALEDAARRHGAGNVQFIEPQPPGRWEAMLQAADVLLVNQRASVADMSLPSKLTAYFAAGRPVVAAVAPDSEAAREIQAAGAGTVVPPEDPASLRDAILALRADATAANAAGASALRYAREHLAADRVLATYEEFVARLVVARR